MTTIVVPREALDRSGWMLAHDPLHVTAAEAGPADLHPYRSAYVETRWLPVIGPTSFVLYRRLAAALDLRQRFHSDTAAAVSFDLHALAVDLGVSHDLSRNAPLTRSLVRLLQFRFARIDGDSLAVRLAVQPLSERQAARLEARQKGQAR